MQRRRSRRRKIAGRSHCRAGPLAARSPSQEGRGPRHSPTEAPDTPHRRHRAGPTLAGIFGRRIATLPGYNFSDALKHLNIVWTPDTVAKLFEVGPMIYTPGTKMPEQKIGSAEDREALVQFLERATK